MTTGTAESYRVFVRNWYRRTAAGGREPGPGRKTILARRCTFGEALNISKRYNAANDPGPLSRKAEFEREGA
jgi:hypothetical protein